MTKILNSKGSIRTVIYTEPTVCANATVENSNSTYTSSIASGGTLVLPDTTFQIYVNGVFNTTVTLPYGENNTLNINA